MHIITSNSTWTLSELLLRTIHIKVQLKYSYFSLITWSTTGVVGRQQRAVRESPAAYRKPFKVLSKLEVSFANTDIGYLINQAHNGNVTFCFFHLNFFLHAEFPGISVCLETNCAQRCRWITMMQIMTATGDKLTVCYCNCNIFRIICCKSSLITRWTFFSDRETVVDTLTNLKFLDGRPTFAVNHVKKSLSSSSNDITQNHSQSQRNSRKTKMQRIESFKQFFRITPRNRVADNSQ